MTLLLPPPVDPGLLSRALEVGTRLAGDAAEVIAATADPRWRRDPATRRNPFDWVADTGRTLERHSRRVLREQFPGIPVIGEECRDSAVEGRQRWLVAPLDGAANYRTGLPLFGYGLALYDADGPVVGVVCDAARAEVCTAARGRGVRLHDLRRDDPAGSDVGPAPEAGPEGLPVCVESESHRRPSGIAPGPVRTLGAPALALTQVALGRAAGAVVQGHHDWQVAAGLALACEAGAVVLDGTGRPDPLPGGGLLVAAPSSATRLLHWWLEG
jgi:myo-inositol-1(or 4)-monophosphatase